MIHRETRLPTLLLRNPLIDRDDNVYSVFMAGNDAFDTVMYDIFFFYNT